jgi:hypothetical protein
MSKTKPTIVGRYFLSFPSDKPGSKGKVNWWGQVLSQQRPGVYLVQTYDWLIGGLSATLLIPIERMVNENWDFYERREDVVHEANRLFEAL